MSHPTPALPDLEPRDLSAEVAAEIALLNDPRYRHDPKNWARRVLLAEHNREKPPVAAVEMAREALFPNDVAVDLELGVERPKKEYETVAIHSARNALLTKYGYQTIEYRGMRTPGEEG